MNHIINMLAESQSMSWPEAAVGITGLLVIGAFGIFVIRSIDKL